jgi:hypothetical protein
MTLTFFDRQDPSNHLNGAKLRNQEELLEVLDALQNRKPFFCELVGENGYTLLLGIGPVWGFAQYSPGDGSTPYLMAVNPSEQECRDHVEFLTASTPTPVSKRYCVPLDTVTQAAAYFIDTGDRSPALLWEVI